MLNRVAEQLRAASRANTLRHPNASDCTVWGKVNNRTSTDVPPVDSGIATLGGMGVISSEDEPDYSYEEKGEGRFVFLQQFTTEGGNWNDADTGVNYYGNMIEALIEPLAKPDEIGHFEADKHDLVTVDMGAGAIQTFQIVDVTGSVAIPPYTRRYVLNPRQDSELGI